MPEILIVNSEDTYSSFLKIFRSIAEEELFLSVDVAMETPDLFLYSPKENMVFEIHGNELFAAAVDISEMSHVLQSIGMDTRIYCSDINKVSWVLQRYYDIGVDFIGGKVIYRPLYGLKDLSVADAALSGNGFDKSIETVADLFNKHNIVDTSAGSLSINATICICLEKLLRKFEQEAANFPFDIGLNIRREYTYAADFAAMYVNGQYVDMDYLSQTREVLDQKVRESRRKLNSYFRSFIDVDEDGESNINYNSPDQVLTLLKNFDFKDENGHYLTSTSDSTLRKVNSPICREIINYRSLIASRDNYCVKYMNAINKNTGRIHFMYKSYGTATSRPTAFGGMNALNIPKKPEIRAAFAAPEGELLSVHDWNAQEIWILAFRSGDQNMISGLRDHDDFFVFCAELFFKQTIQKEDPLRNAIKLVAYQKNYGAYPESTHAELIASGFNFELQQIRDIFKSYEAYFPKAQAALNMFADTARKNLSLNVANTYRAWRPTLEQRKDYGYMMQIERAARNSPLQTYGAKMSKLATHIVNKDLLKSGLPGFVVANIYDEIIVRGDAYYINEIQHIHKEGMKIACEQLIGAPGKVSGYISDRWQVS